MAISTDTILKQIDDLLQRASLAPGQLPEEQFFLGRKTHGARTALATGWAASIERLSPRSSEYREQVDRSVQRYGAAHPRHLLALVGILNALRDDYEAGYMTSIEELIHADLFADFLEMADELLAKGYKDPAAVLTGSVLEEHLRKLCDRDGVAVTSPDGSPRKADTLNADLVKTNAYGKLDQKSVTAWLGLRNDAAHGQYDRYTKEQVALMLEGVRNFLLRYPA
jgi:hypothetical protein